jgi:hypothetical protein
MTRLAALTMSLTLLTLPAWTQSTSSNVPGAIQPPKGAKLVLEADASGDQIYACNEKDGQNSWTLRAPEAQLFDKHRNLIGRHFAGPSWELADKSGVTAKLAGRVDAPDKDAVPWLLLVVLEHSGSGKLSSVTHIQRVNTRGGKPPATGCDASSAGKEARSPYSATYRFYRSKVK